MSYGYPNQKLPRFNLFNITFKIACPPGAVGISSFRVMDCSIYLNHQSRHMTGSIADTHQIGFIFPPFPNCHKLTLGRYPYPSLCLLVGWVSGRSTRILGISNGIYPSQGFIQNNVRLLSYTRTGSYNTTSRDENLA